MFGKRDGSTICEHNRRKHECKLYQGSSICEHNRIRCSELLDAAGRESAGRDAAGHLAACLRRGRFIAEGAVAPHLKHAGRESPGRDAAGPEISNRDAPSALTYDSPSHARLDFVPCGA